MKPLDFKEIGSRIRKQREFLGYTRECLAEKLEITPKFCSDIELGVKGMSIQTLNNFSQILKISADYILYGESAKTTLPQGLVNMLQNCPESKLKYAQDILKAFIMALN